MPLHLIITAPLDRTVVYCTDAECDIMSDTPEHADHVPTLPVAGWIESGRKFSNGKVEFRFTANSDNAPEFPIHRGNYSAAFSDARSYVATLHTTIGA